MNERPSRQDIDPAERGTLQIAPSVVRKIAERVADQVEGTAPVERRIAGVGVGHRGASVKVSGRGSDVDLAIDLALRYPAEVRSVVDAVRSAVTDEVRRVTSYRVRGVNVTVSALVPEAHSRVR
ncbi:Asp23/Gls24 family envelope stress response protein [Saccharomonospora sp. NPDC006951]